MLFAALCFLLTGLLTVKEPRVPPVPAAAGAALAVLRDRPFIVFAALDGLLSTQSSPARRDPALVGLNHTGAPRWMSAVILLINTAFVVAFQARAARGTDSPSAAARAIRQGGVCVAVACVVFALSGGASLWLACSLLVLGALAHALGEVRQASGSWAIAFDLAPDNAQGQYQGTHAMGADLGKTVAPAIFAWLVLVHGALGWIVLALGFAALAAAMPTVVDRGLRKRSDSVGLATTGDEEVTTTV